MPQHVFLDITSTVVTATVAVGAVIPPHGPVVVDPQGNATPLNVNAPPPVNGSIGVALTNSVLTQGQLFQVQITGAIRVSQQKGDIGPQGLPGAQGLQGMQGEVGPQGPIGHQGDSGFQGVDGHQGIQGDVGPQGNDGTQGFQGPPNWDVVGTTPIGGGVADTLITVNIGGIGYQLLAITIL